MFGMDYRSLGREDEYYISSSHPVMPRTRLSRASPRVPQLPNNVVSRCRSCPNARVSQRSTRDTLYLSYSGLLGSKKIGRSTTKGSRMGKATSSSKPNNDSSERALFESVLRRRRRIPMQKPIAAHGDLQAQRSTIGQQK